MTTPDTTMTDAKIQAILKGKRILFVDDTPRSLIPIPEELRSRYGVACETINDLVKARIRLEENTPPVDAVVVDLSMDASNREGFDTRLRVSPRNDGQLLGVWLHERKIPPYLYLTAVQEAFNYQLPGQKDAIILSKYDITISSITRELARILKSAGTSSSET